tara:strand:+ start:524 stop:1003 length:480 start_codon:yes stop_codon:yes gene_type:complete
MIICKSCGFEINGNLTYSIKQNNCPACGNTLLDNEELREIKDIEAKLYRNGLTKNIENNTIYLLSIFIFNEFLSKTRTINSSKIESPDEISFDEIEQEKELSSSIGLEEIRDEVRREFISEDSNEEEAEDDDRIERLKSIAKTSKLLDKKGASVRRIGR